MYEFEGCAECACLRCTKRGTTLCPLIDNPDQTCADFCDGTPAEGLCTSGEREGGET